MSADNWAICPKCMATWDRELAKRRRELESAYGKVSPSAYEGMRRELRAFAAKRIEHDFREDYEIGLDGDGEFSVDYHGQCQVCGFAHNFKHTQAL